MRHLHSGRKLGVSAPHRKAMLRSMTLALLEKEEIQTTPARAKELRWYADRVVTLAKRGDLHSRRQIVKLLGSTQTQHTGQNRVRKVLERLYSTIAPRFKDRNGGYTQMIRLSIRRTGDNAELCVFRYLPAPEDKAGKSDGKKTKSAGTRGAKAAGSKKAAAEKPKATTTSKKRSSTEE